MQLHTSDKIKQIPYITAHVATNGIMIIVTPVTPLNVNSIEMCWVCRGCHLWVFIDWGAYVFPVSIQAKSAFLKAIKADASFIEPVLSLADIYDRQQNTTKSIEL